MECMAEAARQEAQAYGRHLPLTHCTTALHPPRLGKGTRTSWSVALHPSLERGARVGKMRLQTSLCGPL